jgi:hypothetical protein
VARFIFNGDIFVYFNTHARRDKTMWVFISDGSSDGTVAKLLLAIRAFTRMNTER